MCETRDFFPWVYLTFLRVCDSVRAKITSPQHILTNEINHAYMFFKPFINDSLIATAQYIRSYLTVTRECLDYQNHSLELQYL